MIIMSTKESILIRIKGDNKDLKKKLGESDRHMSSFAKNMKKHSGAIKAGLVGVGVAAVAIGAKMFTSTVATGVQLDKMNKTLGISVEQLGRFTYALNQEHASIEVFQIGMKRLSKAMFDADEGLAESVRTFENLNISLYDTAGGLRNVDDVMMETADIFMNMTNNTEKAALAQEMFGKSGMELIPFLEMGSEGINALGMEAEELGIIMSGQTAKDMKAFDDEMTKMKGAVKGVSMQIGTILLPIMKDLLGMLIWGAKYVFPPLAYVINMLLIPIKGVINGFKMWVEVAHAAYDALQGDFSGAEEHMNNMIRLQKEYGQEVINTVKNIKDEKEAISEMDAADFDIGGAEGVAGGIGAGGSTGTGYSRSLEMEAASLGITPEEFAMGNQAYSSPGLSINDPSKDPLFELPNYLKSNEEKLEENSELIEFGNEYLQAQIKQEEEAIEPRENSLLAMIGLKDEMGNMISALDRNTASNRKSSRRSSSTGASV